MTSILLRQGGHKNDEIMSPQELMLQKRLLFLNGPIMSTPPRIDTLTAEYVADMLLVFDHMSHDPIRIFIDSPGGYMSTGYMLYDMIRLVKSPVVTYGRNCMSMAAILLAAGTPGYRYVFPHSSIMLHLPQGSIPDGDVVTLEKASDEMSRLKKVMAEMLIECGVRKTVRQILAEIDRPNYMDPEGAIKFGIADKIVMPDDIQFGPFET